MEMSLEADPQFHEDGINRHLRATLESRTEDQDNCVDIIDKALIPTYEEATSLGDVSLGSSFHTEDGRAIVSMGKNLAVAASRFQKIA